MRPRASQSLVRFRFRALATGKHPRLGDSRAIGNLLNIELAWKPSSQGHGQQTIVEPCARDG